MEDDWQQLSVTVRIGVGEVYAMAVVEGHGYSPDLIDDIRVNVMKMLRDGMAEQWQYTPEIEEELVEDSQEVAGSDG